MLPFDVLFGQMTQSNDVVELHLLCHRGKGSTSTLHAGVLSLRSVLVFKLKLKIVIMQA